MSKGALGLLAAYWPEDTPRYAHVPLKLATDVVLHPVAASAADRPALVTGDGVTTYGQLSAAVKGVAAALRGRAAGGEKKIARVAITAADPKELVAAALGSVEAGMITWVAGAEVAAETMELFGADIEIGDRPGSVPFSELAAPEGEAAKAGRPDFKSPVLVLPKSDRSGEVGHNQKTLSATGIAVGSFYMIDGETQVALADPPTDWLATALLLGTLQRGGTLLAAWGEKPAELPPRVDYLVASWRTAGRRFLGEGGPFTGLRIGAGLILGIEEGFSLSRRRRFARRLRAPILTLYGRNELGPVLGSHPTWFLDDAVGIPLPNVDTRPMNPADGGPLSIGWDAVEEAEVGVKSALAPAGGEIVDGWLRTREVASIDPTGVYFFRAPRLGG